MAERGRVARGQPIEASAEPRQLALRLKQDALAASGVGNGCTLTPGRPAVAARAPGRLDLMGGIADYSGALVLQWPLREATVAAVQGRDDGVLAASSLGGADGAPDRHARIEQALWQRLLAAGDYASTRRLVADAVREPWMAYVAGVLLVLSRERGCDLRAGLSVWIESRVPEGKGVSSSAALEVALMRAVSHLVGVMLDGSELARLCQIAENQVVGAPCGIMDQMTAALGREHALLALLCQPAVVQDSVHLPDELAVWGIDSGIRHAVTGSDYTSVRIAAAMGRRIVMEALAREGRELAAGYLANTPLEWFETSMAGRLPEWMRGSDFIDQYGELNDPVVQLDPGKMYGVRQATAHPIREHDRVRRFAAILRAGASSERERMELGSLMRSAHASYSACGLGSYGTDRLVDLVAEVGPAAGLYGAKITGGGSGGTVAILGRAEAGELVGQVARRYTSETGREAAVFEGSSPGAVHVAVIDPGQVS